MKNIIRFLSITICSIGLTWGSSDSYFGVLFTEVSVRTVISKNGFHLSMIEDPDSFEYFLNKVVVKWNGKEKIYFFESLVNIKNPVLQKVEIFAPTGRENDMMILVVPYNYRRNKDKVDDEPIIDAAQFVFIKGELVNCKLAAAHKDKGNEWQMLEYDHKKKKLVNKRIVKSKFNPYLRCEVSPE